MEADDEGRCAVLDAEVSQVVQHLYRQKDPQSALAIARATGLSTLAVIPALERLLNQGAASRQASSTAGSRLVYQLTAAGRREVGRRAHGGARAEPELDQAG